MAAGSRTLKLSILAETKDLVAGLNTAGKETESFGDKVTSFGKKAALGFAVAGAAALKYAFDAVKAAAEDQAAQELLAKTIEATTSATAAQIEGVEDYITKTSIAIGVTDDELRPAFSRLVRSTKDADEAQRLLNLALDLAAASGKPLETVTNALGKAYDGNTTALGKLGLGLDTNLLKSKDNDAIIRQLETTYGEFAEGAAETAAKKFERIKIATDEAKEAIGAALLPTIEKLSNYLIEVAVPNLLAFIAGLTGDQSFDASAKEANKSAFEFGERVKKVLKTIVEFKEVIIVTSAVLAGMFVISKVTAGVTAVITLINLLIKAYNGLRKSALLAGIAQAFAKNPLAGLAAVAAAAVVVAAANALADKDEVPLAELPGTGRTLAPFEGRRDFDTTPVRPSVPSAPDVPFVPSGGNSGVITTPAKPKIVVPVFDPNRVGMTSAGVRPQDVFDPNRVGMTSAGQSPTTINLTVNGAIDSEGTARTIIDTLNNSFYRGTGGAGNLQIA